MQERHVSDPVTAAHCRPPLALATIAELRDGAHSHAQPELTAEAPKKPDRPYTTKRFDVLRLAT
jgi:hypothetical protein